MLGVLYRFDGVRLSPWSHDFTFGFRWIGLSGVSKNGVGGTDVSFRSSIKKKTEEEGERKIPSGEGGERVTETSTGRVWTKVSKQTLG